MLVGPPDPEAGTEPRVALTRQPMLEPLPAASMARSLADRLPEVLPECEILVSEPTTLNGAEAYRIVLRWQREGTPSFTRLQVFATRSLDLYVLTVEAPTDDLAQAQPLFDGVLRGFRFAA